MNVFEATILGIVEGITEFLPISSTAHLIIVSNFLRISQTEFQKFFEVIIQSGAILAVVFLYFQYVTKHKKLIKPVLFSFIPTAVIGFLLYKVIKTIFFESKLLIIGTMISFGLVFIIIELLIRSKKIFLNKTLSKISWYEAIIIGLNQAMAVVPGVSRAGIVMVTMMGLGYKRDESAIYSFLLAVPTIIIASLYDLYKARELLLHSSQFFLPLIVGFIVSFVTAYFAVKWLIRYLQKSSLLPFGIYRIFLGILLFFLFPTI